MRSPIILKTEMGDVVSLIALPLPLPLPLPLALALALALALPLALGKVHPRHCVEIPNSQGPRIRRD